MTSTSTSLVALVDADGTSAAAAERAQLTLNSIGDAVACTDGSGRLTFLNPVAERMTGWTWAEAAGRPMDEVFRIVDASSRIAVPNPLEVAAGRDRTVYLPLNAVLLRRDGSEIPIEDSAAPIRDHDGRPDGAVIVFRDVTAARLRVQNLAHKAQHDELTGLPNRLLLHDRLRQEVALTQRRGSQIAVLYLDLDGFKEINDAFGHAVGDRLLQSVAASLATCVRASDTISRLGGDEFGVLLADTASEQAAVTARRMLRAVAQTHLIEGRRLKVTASIGISLCPQDGIDPEGLVRSADAAMYRAKREGRSCFRFDQSEAWPVAHTAAER